LDGFGHVVVAGLIIVDDEGLQGSLNHSSDDRLL
jgi:hypothetical protein